MTQLELKRHSKRFEEIQKLAMEHIDFISDIGLKALIKKAPFKLADVDPHEIAAYAAEELCTDEAEVKRQYIALMYLMQMVEFEISEG